MDSSIKSIHEKNNVYTCSNLPKLAMEKIVPNKIWICREKGVTLTYNEAINDSQDLYQGILADTPYCESVCINNKNLSYQECINSFIELFSSSYNKAYNEVITTNNCLSKKDPYPKNQIIARDEGLYNKGIQAYFRGEYQIAIEYLEKAKFLLENKPNKNDVDLFSIYNGLGRTYQAQENHKEALKYYQKVLKIMEPFGKKYNDEITEYLADIYDFMGSTYRKKGNYFESLEFYKKALKIKKRFLGENHISISTTYNNIGILYSESFQDYPTSLKYYNKALIIVIELKKDIQIATTYNNIGLVYHNMGKYKEALKYYKKSLILKNKTPNKWVDTATTYNNIASLYQNIGDYKQALAFHKKALILRKKTVGIEHTDTAQSYTNIGLFYKTLGNYKQALNYYKEALWIYTKVLGEYHKNTATVYNNIAEVYETMGDCPKALKFHNKALTIRESILKPNHTDIAQSYNNIGMLYDNLGDYIQALEYLKKSLNIEIEAFGEKHNSVALTYNNMGKIFSEKKEYFKAINYFIKSLNISETILGKKHIDVARTNDNISMVYKEIEEYQKALKYSLKALEIKEEILGTEHIDTALNYNNLGTIYQEIEEYVKGLDYHLKSLNIDKNILGKNHFRTIQDYNNIGTCFSNMRNYNKSYQYSKVAFNLNLYRRKQNFPILNNREKLEYIKQDKFILLSMLYSFLSYNKVEEALNNWLNYKRTIFDQESKFKLLSNKTKDKNIKSKIDELFSKRRQLGIVHQNIPKEKIRVKNRLAYIKTLEKSISDIEKFLSSKISNFDFKNIKYQDISKHLKQNELYMDFVETTNGYFLFTLDSKNSITSKQFDVNRSIEINKTINEILNNTHVKAEKFGNLAEAKREYSTLYNLIIRDINLKNKTSLIISPDGLLGLIPFEAFYDGEKYLIQKLKIRYIPSGKELVKLHRDNRKTKNSDVVVFADVNFDNKNLKSQETKGNIFNSLTPNNPYLKYSKRDAEIVKKLFPNHTKLFLKERATEENLLKVNAPKILYLSTHGTFLRDKSILNPMLKSIILLDGANESIRQKRGNGIVSGLELAGLNLRGTELVVLSACETGVGEIEDGEGVAGLSKAFMEAGAKNVIMTLWSVDDKKSSELMERFFEGVKRGLGYSDALRKAKIWMIENRNSHPFYWSGFVGSGKD